MSPTWQIILSLFGIVTLGLISQSIDKVADELKALRQQKGR